MKDRKEVVTGRRSRKKWLIAGIAIGLVALIYPVVYFIADSQLTRLLPRAIAEAVGGRDADRYTVRIGDVRFSPTLRGLTLEELAISVDTAGAEEASEPALVRGASLSSVRVSGVRILPLIRGQGIFVSTVDIDAPSVTLDFASVQRKARSPGEMDPGEPAPTAGPAAPPTASLNRITIRDGSIDLARSTEYGILESYLRGLDVELTDIRIDSVAFANPARALVNSRVSIGFDSAQHTLDDSLYVVMARHVRADSRDSVLEIGSVEFTPTLEAARFFPRLAQRADQIDMSAGPIRIEGLDFADYVNAERVHLRMIDVDSLDLHVYSNINLDWGPRARPCRYHMGFKDIPFPLRIDTIRVDDGFIRYSELAKGASRAGELTLDELNGTVLNLTNDPERMTMATPLVANVTARLFGAGDMEATLSYPLLSPTLDFRVEGTVGPMALTAVNGFTTSVVGVEAKKGRADGLSLTMDVRNGQATGNVVLRYQDLDIGLLSRDTGGRNVFQSVGGFLGNLVLRSNNPGKPGDTPREGRIDYTCGQNDIVFFEFFVHALATGLKRIVIG